MTQQKFLLSRGWKRHLSSWWYKSIPAWKGRIAPYQRIYGVASAFDLERKILMGFPVEDPVDEYMRQLNELREESELAANRLKIAREN